MCESNLISINDAVKQNIPSNRYYEIPWMYEDELPEDLPDNIYDWWFENSIVDGVRIGPKI